ncbi:MAG: lysylphosphatidylglycerol synthase transmembrane domain-containing protein [Pseudomonadota bacterium]
MNQNQPASPPRSNWQSLLSVLLAVALIAGLILFAGADLLDAIAASNPWLLTLSLLLSATTFPLASWRWWMISNALAGYQISSFHDFLRARVALACGGLVAPRELVETGGRTLWLIKFRQQRPTLAINGVLIDRICDLGISGVALSGGLVLLLWQPPATAAAGITLASSLALVAMILALQLVLPRLLPSAGRSADQPHINEHPPWRMRLLESRDIWLNMPTRVVAAALALSVVKFYILLVRAVVVGLAVGSAVSAADLLTISPWAQMANLVSLTPGGFGVYEASWFGLLQMLGAAIATAVAFVLVQRVCELTSIISMLPFVGNIRRTFAPLTGAK